MQADNTRREFNRNVVSKSHTRKEKDFFFFKLERSLFFFFRKLKAVVPSGMERSTYTLARD